MEETIVNWISVEDRLPEPGKDVLVRIEEDWYAVASLRQYDNNWWFANDLEDFDTATHWTYISFP